jgi:hypothetical protein
MIIEKVLATKKLRIRFATSNRSGAIFKMLPNKETGNL